MSGPLCKCCTHPDREAIDRAILEGTASLRSIAERYGMSCQAVIRHRGAHIPPPAVAAAVQAATEADTNHGVGLVRGASELRERAMALLAKAEEDGDIRTALSGVREAARCLELVAKMTGLIDQTVQVNIALSAEFTMLRGAILTALAPHPEARTAVVKALAGLS